MVIVQGGANTQAHCVGVLSIQLKCPGEVGMMTTNAGELLEAVTGQKEDSETGKSR